MINKDLNTLLKSGKLTGKEVGLMAIKDQVQIYETKRYSFRRSKF